MPGGGGGPGGPPMPRGGGAGEEISSRNRWRRKRKRGYDQEGRPSWVGEEAGHPSWEEVGEEDRQRQEELNKEMRKRLGITKA